MTTGRSGLCQHFSIKLENQQFDCMPIYSNIQQQTTYSYRAQLQGSALESDIEMMVQCRGLLVDVDCGATFKRITCMSNARSKIQKTNYKAANIVRNCNALFPFLGLRQRLIKRIYSFISET